MKRFVFLFFLLLASSVFAFTITVPEETIIVPIGTSDEIDVTLSSSTSESISITVLENSPWITQSESLIQLNAGEKKIVKLYITPFIETQIGVHRITLLAESQREEQKKYVFININKIELVDAEKVTVTGNFVPTGQASITGVLKNYKDITAEDVKVIVTVKSPSSQVVQFEQIINSIDSGETTNISYSFSIPRYSESGLYSVNVTTITDGEARSKIRTFSVANSATFSKEVTTLPAFFGFRKRVTVTNIGNFIGDATVTDSVSSMDASFYSGETPASIRNGEATWIIKNIGPGDSQSIVYGVDYSPAVLLLLVLGIGSWVYMFKIRTTRIKKYIIEKKFIEEGEEFTVGIEAINASGVTIDNVVVKDFVPSVFDIRELEGGPKPSRRKVATGTELIWNLKDLHHNEERVFSYKIIPMFGIHGQIRLPQATVSYKKGKKDIENKSFFANIGIEMDSYKDKKKRI